MELFHRPRSSLTTALARARRVVDGETGIVKLLHEAPIAPDAPQIFGCGALCSDFGTLGFPSESDVSGSTSVVRAQAIVAAVGEAVERYSAAYVAYERLVYDTPDALAAAKIEPESVVLYDDRQYVRPNFVFQPFDRRRVIGWIEGRALVSGQAVLVPAFAVFQPYVSQIGEAGAIQQVTTGLACGTTLEDAVLSGLCEVVERDAAMLAWLQRRRLPKLDTAALPAGLARITLERFGGLAGNVTLLDATTEIGIPVYIAVWQGSMLGARRALFCSCAKPNADLAAAGALRELAQCMMWAESLIDGGRHLPDPMTDPITEIEQHVLWPLRPDLRDRYAFLLGSDELVPLHANVLDGDCDALDLIDGCARRLQRCGLGAIAVDVTSPDIAEAGFHVARVVVPGAQPLFFGSGLERLSPRALAGGDPAALNLHPHPFP